MAVSAMEREERLEIGEKIFVSSTMAALVTEAGVGLVGNGLHLTWPGVLFSVISFAVLAGLASQVYRGNRTARQVMLGWVGLQLLLSAGALVILGLSGLPVPELSYVALPTSWLALIKLVVYVGLGAALLRSRDVLTFLAHKRGEEHVHGPTAADLLPEPTGVTVPLSEAQEGSLGALALLVQAASLVLLVAGVFRILLGVKEINAALNASKVVEAAVAAGALTLAEGVLTALIGLFLLAPAGAAQLLRSEGTDTAYVANAADSFKSFFDKQIVLSLALAAVLVGGIVVWFLR
jgi:hypothetical protein